MSSYNRRSRHSTLNTVVLILFIIAVLLAAVTLVLLHLRSTLEKDPDSVQASGGLNVPLSPSAPVSSADPVPSYSTTDPVPSSSGQESPAPSSEGPEETSPSNSDGLPWYLTLVNPTHSLPEDFSVETEAIYSTLSFDTRAVDALREMLADCEAAGLQPLVCSAFRTQETQEKLFQNKVNEFRALGYDDDSATEAAGRIVAVPGTSEHQLGLAADIVDATHQALDNSQENTAVQKWLMEHCWEHGFILRYPSDKSEQTGIIYEPWHYRYVGKEYARKITDSGLCLEEYLAQEFGVA